jgi:type II secretory pathway component PulJ
MSTPQPSQHYSQDDIQDILNLAITRQAYDGEFTREQLIEIATELGITADCLQLAEQDWLNQKIEQQKRTAFHQHRQGQLVHKLGRFTIVNSSLLTLNFLTSSHLGWSLYIVLFWGAGIALDAWKTYNPRSVQYEQAYQQWKRKNQIKSSLSTIWRRLQQAWEEA